MSKIVKIDDWIYYEITTDDEPSIIQIKRQQAHFRDTEGDLYPVGFPEDDRIIGRWWNVNVDAEKWEHEAGLFRFALEENIKRLEMYKEDNVQLQEYLEATLKNRSEVIDQMKEELRKWQEVATALYGELKFATECCYEEASSADNAIKKLKMYEDAKGK